MTLIATDRAVTTTTLPRYDLAQANTALRAENTSLRKQLHRYADLDEQQRHAIDDLTAALADPSPLADRDRHTITAAILADAQAHDGVVSPNRVRAALSNAHGLTVRPRMLSATYSALAARGVLRSLGWNETNDDVAGGNAGKPARTWQWVGPR